MPRLIRRGVVAVLHPYLVTIDSSHRRPAFQRIDVGRADLDLEFMRGFDLILLSTGQHFLHPGNEYYVSGNWENTGGRTREPWTGGWPSQSKEPGRRPLAPPLPPDQRKRN